MTYHFNSQVQLGEPLPNFTELEIKNEPMLFNCNYDAAWNLGGIITRSFLKSLPYNFYSSPDFVFDSRVHMLKTGWFPCIPGYHHDDVPRSTINGQPNYDSPEYLSQHAMALINGDICPTEYALGECEMLKINESQIIYKEWHKEIIKLLEKSKLDKWSTPTNQVILFDWQSFHQGTRAVKDGWRWFGRASKNTHRKPTNEIRNQVQVYLEFPMEGW